MMFVQYEAAAHVENALQAIGRSEDLAFSPDNQKLAIASYALNKILILNIEISGTTDNRILIHDFFEILSPDLDRPHGITWIDKDHIVVANRFAQTIVLPVPIMQAGQRQIEQSALQILPSVAAGTLNSNDCVAVAPLGQDLYEVLVCSNNGNYVASHILNHADNFNVLASSILLQSTLDIPDGIAISENGRWIAVSDHTSHSVYIYENLKSLNPASLPCAILPGICYPHGITFCEGDHVLFVSAAGAPYIYGYHSVTGEWYGEHQPFTSFRSVDDETFARGHYNEQEGGVKGLSLAHGTHILAMTCGERPLAFVDISTSVNMLEHDDSSRQHREVDSPKAESHLWRIVQCMQINQARLINIYDEDMQKIVSSKSWKMTQPLRILKHKLNQFSANARSRFNLSPSSGKPTSHNKH